MSLRKQQRGESYWILRFGRLVVATQRLNGIRVWLVQTTSGRGLINTTNRCHTTG